MIYLLIIITIIIKILIFGLFMYILSKLIKKFEIKHTIEIDIKTYNEKSEKILSDNNKYENNISILRQGFFIKIITFFFSLKLSSYYYFENINNDLGFGDFGIVLIIQENIEGYFWSLFISYVITKVIINLVNTKKIKNYIKMIFIENVLFILILYIFLILRAPFGF